MHWRRIFPRSKRGFDEKNAFPAIRTTLGHGSRFVRPTRRGTEPRSPPHVLSPRVGGFSRAPGDSSARGGIQRAWAGMSGGGAASDVGAQVMAMDASRHAWRPQGRGGHRDGCAPKSWASESSPVQSYDRLSDFQRTAPRLCTVVGTFWLPEIEFASDLLKLLLD